MELKDVRNVLRQDETGVTRSRLLHFTPQVDGPVKLSIVATGVNAPETLRITTADLGSVTEGGLALTTRSGERCTVRITFDEDYDGPLEITAVKIVPSEKPA